MGRRKRKVKRVIVKMRRRKMIGRVKSPRNQEKMIARMRVKMKNQRRRRNVMTLIQTITSLLLRRRALLKSLKEMILKMNLKTNDHHELRALRESLSIKMNLMSLKMKNQQRKQSQSLFKRSVVQEVNLAVILMAQDKHLVERRRRLLLLILTLILTSTWQIVIGHQSRVNPTDPIKAVDDHHQTSARNHLAKRGRLRLALALTIQILMMTEEREEVVEENQAKVRSQKRRKRAVTIHTLKMIIALMIPGQQRRRRVEDQKAAVVVVVDICKK